MPTSPTLHDDVGYLPPASRVASSTWAAARKNLVDLIPFLSMVALLAFVIIDNARG